MNLLDEFVWAITKIPYKIYRNSTFRKKKYILEQVGKFKEPENPFIVIANHSNFNDAIITCRFIKNKVWYMAHVEPLSLFLKLVAKLAPIFDKKTHMRDIEAIRKLYDFVEKKRSVGFFPEGKRTWNGETAEYSVKAAKLIKKLKVSVIVVKIIGNYIAHPRWAEVSRQGKILVKYSLITKEEIRKMGAEELHKKIQSLMYTNDIKEAKLKTRFKGDNLALGVRFFLWKCPHCMKEDTIYGDQNTIICKDCGSKFGLNANLEITPSNTPAGEDLKDWDDWQKNEIAKLCERADEDTPLTTTKDIELYLYEDLKKDKIEYNAYGDFTLFKNKIIFIPKDKNKKILEINLSKISYYFDRFNKYFTFRYLNKVFVIKFYGKNAYKWVLFIRHIQENPLKNERCVKK